MQYAVHGPFVASRGDGRNIELAEVKTKASNFWQQVAQHNDKLVTARGVYIFGVRTGGGITPYYVGKTRARRGFFDETFAARNLVRYNDVLLRRIGTAVIFFLARPTRRGLGFFSLRDREVAFLEKLMIGLALGRNDDLINVHHARLARSIQIPGIVGQWDRRKALNASEASFKAMMRAD